MRLLLQNGYYSEIPVPLLFTNATDSFTVFTFPALHYHSTSFIKCFCHLSCSTSKFPWLVLMPVSATGRYRSWKQGPGDPLGFPPCFLMGFPGGSGQCRRSGIHPGVGKISWRIFTMMLCLQWVYIWQMYERTNKLQNERMDESMKRNGFTTYSWIAK